VAEALQDRAGGCETQAADDGEDDDQTHLEYLTVP
jgi:hypothetical protein